MNLYTRSHTVENNDALVNYRANYGGVPDLLVWYPVCVGRKGDMGLLTINKIIQPYLENMTDEERQIVAQQVAHVARLHTVTGIDAYEDMFILHTDINNQPISAVVCVLNMMDFETS